MTLFIQGPCEGDSGGPGYIGGHISEEHGGIVDQKLVWIHVGGASCGKRQEPQWHTKVIFTHEHEVDNTCPFISWYLEPQ